MTPETIFAKVRALQAKNHRFSFSITAPNDGQQSEVLITYFDPNKKRHERRANHDDYAGLAKIGEWLDSVEVWK